MTSVISTPMAKMSSALQRSLSSARLVGHPSPLKSAHTSRFLRSSSSVTQVFDTTLNGCESPGLKRGTSARKSASKLTPYKYESFRDQTFNHSYSIPIKAFFLVLDPLSLLLISRDRQDFGLTIIQRPPKK